MQTQWRMSAYAAFAALTVLSGVASAQQAPAVINGPANLHAGPARDYPLVAQLAPGTPVTVMGCVAGYSWCDVALPDLRGWVYAGRLSYAYQGGYVPVLNYGMTLGLPIVEFSLDSYWGNYYRGRPWFADQGRWAHHPPPPMARPGVRPPPRPLGPEARPPGPGAGAGRPPAPGPGAGRPPQHPAGDDRGQGGGDRSNDRGSDRNRQP